MQRPRPVLVVEDDALLRACLGAFLARRGHLVLTAGSLAEARALLIEGPFGAAVIDVGLPDGSGLELLARTGASRSLVVSARPEAAAYARSGVRHHREKPLDLSDVARFVETFLAA